MISIIVKVLKLAIIPAIAYLVYRAAEAGLLAQIMDIFNHWPPTHREREGLAKTGAWRTVRPE